MPGQSARKAYAVMDRVESTGEIVFARTKRQAAKIGSSSFADGDEESVEAERCEWADEFEPAGDVPKLVMLDHGWWFECTGCSRRVSEDANDYLDEGERPIEPYERRGDIYCCRACAAEHKFERRWERRIKVAVSLWWSDRLVKNYPGARPDHVHVYASHGSDGWEIRQATVYFEFPGSKIGPATYGFNGKEVTLYVCHGDLPAFNAWQQPAGDA